MDYQERELLASMIGDHLGWYVREQTKHMIEAMSCDCERARVYISSDMSFMSYKPIVCNRCKKLKELNK